MGRGVSVPYNASLVAYRDVSDYDEWDWEWFVEWVQETAKTQWPSMGDIDEWVGREDRAVAENQLAKIGVSEYCGLASIWMVTKEDEYDGSYYSEDRSLAPLARRFAETASEKFHNNFGEYERVGTFSNGESFYRKV